MSRRTGTDWAQPGVEVVELTYGIGGPSYGAQRRIGKVYKNGNFVLEGSADQWSPSSDGTALRTNRDSFRGRYLTLLTDEVKEDVRAFSEMRRAKNTLREWEEALSAAQRSNNAERVISLADRLGPAPEKPE